MIPLNGNFLGFLLGSTMVSSFKRGIYQVQNDFNTF